MEDFLLCFSRFCSIRGQPAVVYSDNGTNFVAAERELKEEFEIFEKTEQDLKILLNCRRIEWHFSPPHGPHNFAGYGRDL